MSLFKAGFFRGFEAPLCVCAHMCSSAVLLAVLRVLNRYIVAELGAYPTQSQVDMNKKIAPRGGEGHIYQSMGRYVEISLFLARAVQAKYGVPSEGVVRV